MEERDSYDVKDYERYMVSEDVIVVGIYGGALGFMHHPRYRAYSGESRGGVDRPQVRFDGKSWRVEHPIYKLLTSGTKKSRKSYILFTHKTQKEEQA